MLGSCMNKPRISLSTLWKQIVSCLHSSLLHMQETRRGFEGAVSIAVAAGVAIVEVC